MTVHSSDAPPMTVLTSEMTVIENYPQTFDLEDSTIDNKEKLSLMFGYKPKFDMLDKEIQTDDLIQRELINKKVLDANFESETSLKEQNNRLLKKVNELKE